MRDEYALLFIDIILLMIGCLPLTFRGRLGSAQCSAIVGAGRAARAAPVIAFIGADFSLTRLLYYASQPPRCGMFAAGAILLAG